MHKSGYFKNGSKLNATMLQSTWNYNPFGSAMPTRTWSDPNSKYKYGFNGKEKDNDINVDGGSYDFGARIYDSRLGRWLALDPLMKKKVFLTPYSANFNNPIIYNDPDGKDEILRITMIDKRTNTTTTFDFIIEEGKFHQDIAWNDDGSYYYAYYNIFHQVTLTFDESGVASLEVNNSVIASESSYTRHPALNWIGYSKLIDGDLSGKGENTPGGVVLTSEQGGATPTKSKTLNPNADNIDITTLLETLPGGGKVRKRVDLMDKFKKLGEKLNEIVEKNKKSKKEEDKKKEEEKLKKDLEKNCDAYPCSNPNCKYSDPNETKKAFEEQYKNGTIPSHPAVPGGHGSDINKPPIKVPCK